MTDGLVVLDNTGTLYHIRDACGSNQLGASRETLLCERMSEFHGDGTGPVLTRHRSPSV